MPEFTLGWRPPEDRSHERRYAMAEALPAAPTPVVIGIKWYENFDRPQDWNGAKWIGLGDWGKVRGGHAVCLRPPAIKDVTSAWQHYNQGREGACVGFATSRAATLFNRKLYDGLELYRRATTRDPWEGDWRNYSGTSVNAGLDTLRLDGAWPVRAGKTSGPVLKDGITGFVWAKSADEVKQALGSSEPFARVLNSWGAAYPAEVRISWDAITRLIKEDGEFAAPSDRP